MWSRNFLGEGENGAHPTDGISWNPGTWESVYRFSGYPSLSVVTGILDSTVRTERAGLQVILT